MFYNRTQQVAASTDPQQYDSNQQESQGEERPEYIMYGNNNYSNIIESGSYGGSPDTGDDNEMYAKEFQNSVQPSMTDPESGDDEIIEEETIEDEATLSQKSCGKPSRDNASAADSSSHQYAERVLNDVKRNEKRRSKSSGSIGKKKRKSPKKPCKSEQLPLNSQPRGIEDVEDEYEDYEQHKELHRNILIGLIVAVLLFAILIVGMGVFLALWINAENGNNETTTVVPATAAPVDNRNNPSPTVAPVAAPTTTAPPTVAPTPAPVAPIGAWTLRNGNTLSSSSGSTDLAMVNDDTLLIAAAPDNAVGNVETFQRSNGGVPFAPLNLVTEPTAEEFGTAVDATTTNSNSEILCAGAPRTVGAQQPLVNFGGAHCYQRSGGPWVAMPVSNSGGNVIRSFEALEEAGGLFGSAVAVTTMSNGTPLLAVGAPSSSLNGNTVNTGRVYLFQAETTTQQQLTWQPQSPLFLNGPAESFFGHALDLSEDGLRLVVGAPGNGAAPGLVVLYEWNGAAWTQLYQVTGTGATDALGTTVQFLDAAGTQFVAGAPGSGAGVVRVFGRSSSSSFTELDNLQGHTSIERIGTTLAATHTGRFAVGTETGLVRVFHVVNNAVVPLGGSNEDDGSLIRTGTTTDAITSLALADSGSVLAVGSASGSVRVYDLL